MGFLKAALRLLFVDLLFSTLLGGGMRNPAARLAAVIALGMVLPLFVAAHKFARVMTAPPPSYMHDVVVQGPPAPIVQTYVRRAGPAGDPNAIGFDAVFGPR